jgi:hypothetical protein
MATNAPPGRAGTPPSPSSRPHMQWHGRTTVTEVLLQCSACGQQVAGELDHRGRLTFHSIAGAIPASEVLWKAYCEAEDAGQRAQANGLMWQYRHVVREDPERHIHLRDGGTLVAFRPDGRST